MAKVISEEQKRLNKTLHKDREDFGNRSEGAGLGARLTTALTRMHQLGVCSSVLDYGCGKGKLVQRLQEELPDSIKMYGYDPAIDEYENKPDEAVDVVTCLDVLEHIEMESIDAVLEDIKALSKRFCYLVIDLQPAVKFLADGRNAHILLAPQDWWVTRISQHFRCQASFPIMHIKGVPQKLVVAATDDTRVCPCMYSFLIKMKLFHFNMTGGILGKPETQEEVKEKTEDNQTSIDEKPSKEDSTN